MRLVLAACAAIALGSPALAQTPNQPGRYIIVSNPERARDNFLLDTATGRVWQLQKFGTLNGDPEAWVLMDKVDTPADEQRMIQMYGRKVPAAPK